MKIGKARLTAFATYIDRILLHRAGVVVPVDAAWAWLLGRCGLGPRAVTLLDGATGARA